MNKPAATPSTPATGDQRAASLGRIEYASGSSDRAAQWTFALLVASAVYPLLTLAMLYAAWVAARVALGHWPRTHADDPARIGAVVELLANASFLLFAFLLPAGGVSFLLVFSSAVLGVQRELHVPKGGWFRIALPVLTWSATFAVCDPRRFQSGRLRIRSTRSATRDFSSPSQHAGAA